METTLTHRGQTVVPAEIRKRYNLQEGDKLIWIDDGQTIKVIFSSNAMLLHKDPEYESLIGELEMETLPYK